jgi:hypothetical protein
MWKNYSFLWLLRVFKGLKRLFNKEDEAYDPIMFNILLVLDTVIYDEAEIR